MDIYFFSPHVPDPKMIQDLGAPIKTRFRGEISNIVRKGNCISFTETLYLGGQLLKPCYTIPAESIVVVEGSPLLQSAWLAAGVETLLVPQMKSEVGVHDCVVLNPLLSLWRQKNIVPILNLKQNHRLGDRSLLFVI